MTVAETLLVYALIPLAVTAVLAALTLRPDPKARRRRYRPGQPWEHEPVWYSPHSGQAAVSHGADTSHGRTLALGASAHGDAGNGHGSTVTTGAPVAARGGPLGGARGTW